MRLINSSVVGRRAIILLLGASLSLTGCAGFGGKGGYDQSKAGRSLEVPPDLTPPQTDQTYAIPGETARASAATARPGVSTQPRATMGEIEPRVLPQYREMRVAGEGSARWIEVPVSAEALWPQLESFWDSQGLPLERNEPELGIMETQWLEDRSGLPQSPTQKLVALLGMNPGTGLRDKFRIRLERVSDDTTRLYLTHRGAERYFVDDSESYWKTRPSDPELEAEMLAQLMVFLGHEEGGARQQLAQVGGAQLNVRLTRVDDQPALIVEAGLTRTWWRVAAALDRAGLSVERQSQGEGVFYVTFQGDEGQKKSFFKDRLGIGGGPLHIGHDYQVHLYDQGDQVEITAHDAEGEPLRAEASEEILIRLQSQLR